MGDLVLFPVQRGDPIQAAIHAQTVDTLIERASDYVHQRRTPPGDYAAQLDANLKLLRHALEEPTMSLGDKLLGWYIVGGHGFVGYREGFGMQYPNRRPLDDSGFIWDMETPVGLGLSHKRIPQLQIDVWPSSPTTLKVHRVYQPGGLGLVGIQYKRAVMKHLESAAADLGFVLEQ
jgi:hypothetical protein